MKSSEEAIEKVLAGLRDAEAPVGMERRILEMLEDQASERLRPGWRFRPIWLFAPERRAVTVSLACGVALAGMLAVALMVPAIRRLGHAPAQAKMNFGSMRPLPTAASAVEATSVQLPPARSETRWMTKASVRRGVVVRDGNSEAGSAMQEASFPAPPMPLTEQERLLLRIAHKGDPVELAELNPVVRAARDSEAKAEVKKFFEPSTTGENK
jgi:hypothetical protein